MSSAHEITIALSKNSAQSDNMRAAARDLRIDVFTRFLRSGIKCVGIVNTAFGPVE